MARTYQHTIFNRIANSHEAIKSLKAASTPYQVKSAAEDFGYDIDMIRMSINGKSFTDNDYARIRAEANSAIKEVNKEMENAYRRVDSDHTDCDRLISDSTIELIPRRSKDE